MVEPVSLSLASRTSNSECDAVATAALDEVVDDENAAGRPADLNAALVFGELRARKAPMFISRGCAPDTCCVAASALERFSAVCLGALVPAFALTSFALVADAVPFACVFACPGATTSEFRSLPTDDGNHSRRTAADWMPTSCDRCESPHR